MSLSTILKIFLTFEGFDPGDFYKADSYKKMVQCVLSEDESSTQHKGGFVEYSGFLNIHHKQHSFNYFAMYFTRFISEIFICANTNSQCSLLKELRNLFTIKSLMYKTEVANALRNKADINNLYPSITFYLKKWYTNHFLLCLTEFLYM